MLHKLEPERFKETPDDGCWYEDFKLGLLYLGLKVGPDTPLPTVFYEGLGTWGAFATALSQHYTANGRPLSSQNTVADLQKGFYTATQTENEHLWSVTCRLDHQDPKVVLKFDGEDLEFDDPFNYNTGASIQKDGRSYKLKDLLQEFVAKGVVAPPLSPDWTGPAFATKKEPATPKSAAEGGKSSKGKGTKRPSPSPPSGAGVSAALRQRLASKSSGSAASSGKGR